MAKKTPNWKKLENDVAKQFRRLGYRTKISHMIYFRADGKKLWSEIDVYGYKWFGLRKMYVECKAYKRKLIPLKEIAKFKMVLIQNKIPVSKALFVYKGKEPTDRCNHVGIEIISFDELKGVVGRAVWKKRLFWLGLIAVGGSYYFQEIKELVNRWVPVLQNLIEKLF